MSLARRCLPFASVAALCAWVAFSNSATGDFPADAGLAVHGLTHGHVGQLLTLHATGPFAILLQAPFALLGRGSPLTEYQWACFPCLLAAGLLGIYLASIGRRRGISQPAQCAIALLCLLNPLTFEALQAGHPEEILTAALAVAAIAVAGEGRDRGAAILLGLAIVSKQWAVIAALPVLMALPERRVRAALTAAGIAVALTLPILIAGLGSFAGGQSELAATSGIVDPWNIWYPLAHVTTTNISVDSGRLVVHLHRAPGIAGVSHSLIVLLAVVLPLGLVLRRRRFGLSGADAMALFALLVLLRCALDPVGNLYYHEPLLLALIGWDAVSCKGWPLRGLAGAAVAALFWRWSQDLSDPQTLNFAYIAIAASVGSAIAVFLIRRRRSTSESSVAADSLPVVEPTTGRSYGEGRSPLDGFAVKHP